MTRHSTVILPKVTSQPIGTTLILIVPIATNQPQPIPPQPLHPEGQALDFDSVNAATNL
ncbi:hypothetical protein PtA15_10A625 [Puccinia triticina]|uniref:Uncharacterized protein n=1 Tax=Puccinia triticina TaxID=208348 RepID=A0ABY7CYK5_9BASI|nr:uncharacterized protein PtA15_10A625 [Puccinia triticina]WAQ89201.1 hypothetical protein PtA15_10A625 [Puccinia triticina]WAR59252.1 hypothetical protein PtB15_10B594 [Puccinia triticina]